MLHVKFNPLMLVGNYSYQFLICCPRDAFSRTANVERNGGHKWVNLNLHGLCETKNFLVNRKEVVSALEGFGVCGVLCVSGALVQLRAGISPGYRCRWHFRALVYIIYVYILYENYLFLFARINKVLYYLSDLLKIYF